MVSYIVLELLNRAEFHPSMSFFGSPFRPMSTGELYFCEGKAAWSPGDSTAFPTQWFGLYGLICAKKGKSVSVVSNNLNRIQVSCG